MIIHDDMSSLAVDSAEPTDYYMASEVSNDWIMLENSFAQAKIATYIAHATEDGSMTLTGLRQLAKSVGVTGMQQCVNAVELIHAIQLLTHRRNCSDTTANSSCHQLSCLWRAECKKLVADWHR
jgi:hypothetical protein